MGIPSVFHFLRWLLFAGQLQAVARHCDRSAASRTSPTSFFKTLILPDP